MRVISQNGRIDIPYGYFSLSMSCAKIASGKVEDRNVFSIVCHNLSSPNGTKLAEYSTEEKAKKAMEMLRDAYTGMPIAMQNVDISEDIAKEFERLKKCGVLVRTDNQPSKVEYINNVIFQFPAEEELE